MQDAAGKARARAGPSTLGSPSAQAAAGGGGGGTTRFLEGAGFWEGVGSGRG